ncbi:hypothetical protein Fmac_028624 [Flemingia macrophylla]|uniref:Uncharacterized protein n=1 Tax=Flemingia macrophylla TaxID=520843 RepID=A0ABD1L9G7_9FABA
MRGVHDVAIDTSAETRKLEGMLDALVNLVTLLAVNQKFAPIALVCGIRSSNDHITSVCPSSQQSDTSAETRKLEGKLDALVNLVTQLATNQKPASVARVCGIRSSNDHHTSVCPSSQQSGVDEHPESYARSTYSRPPQHAWDDAIVIRGVHYVATDTSAETRKLEGKLDALVNLVTQLAANQKPALLQYARNDAIVIRGVHHVATDTSAETRKLEGKLDAFVNLVTQLATNQKSASVARVCGIRFSNEHHTSVCPSLQESEVFSARNDTIVIRGVHDVATDTPAETRMLEGKLDALVNFVTQVAANQKPTSVAKVYGIRSSNDYHTSVCPSSQQSGVYEHPEANAVNTYRVHDVAADTSAETRKLEGKLDALVNLVTQLVVNQKPASVARVYGIHFSNDHHTSVCPSSQQSRVDEHLRHMLQSHIADHHSSRDKTLDSEDGSQLLELEGKLDALVNLVTQLAANQKPASIPRACDIRSSNNHHTSVCPSSQLSGVDEHPEANAANTYRRRPQLQRQDT